MTNGRSTIDQKEDYLEETDAEEQNVGSVVPTDVDAMGIRNDQGVVGGDADTPVFGEDDDADEENFDELEEDDEAEIKHIGIGIPGNPQKPASADLLDNAVSLDELDEEEISNDDNAITDTSSDLEDPEERVEELEGDDLDDLENEKDADAHPSVQTQSRTGMHD